MPTAAKPPTLDDLRRYAVARTLFAPTTLMRAIDRLGFVQADPIRAPARAQDLILRHRVAGYHAGDLERRYARLPVAEDFLVNYGFVPRRVLALMHPRTARRAWDAATERKAAEVLAFVRERGAVHPREVEARFAHGRVTNWFGGTSNAATQLLDGMHHRGLLRVVRRDSGTRVYAAADPQPAPADAAAAAARASALLELVVRAYAPLPSASLGYLTSLLGIGVSILRTARRANPEGVRGRLASCRIDATAWYWPADENPRARRWQLDDRVRVLAPFDPIVWDRRRFELLWGWTYRFEAYTPAPKRTLGYYALPLLWGDTIVGWANASVRGGNLSMSSHFVDGRPGDPLFDDALKDERARLVEFLGL